MIARKTFRRLSIILCLSAFVSAFGAIGGVASARAEAAAPAAEDTRRPGQLARERVDELLRSLEKFVTELPRYGLPQIAENGDIVIPRLDKPGETRPSRSPDDEDVTNI